MTKIWDWFLKRLIPDAALKLFPPAEDIRFQAWAIRNKARNYSLPDDPPPYTH